MRVGLDLYGEFAQVKRDQQFGIPEYDEAVDCKGFEWVELSMVSVEHV